MPFTKSFIFGSVMAKVLNRVLDVNKFKLQLPYYVPFLTKTLWKVTNPFILQAMI